MSSDHKAVVVDGSMQSVSGSLSAYGKSHCPAVMTWSRSLLLSDANRTKKIALHDRISNLFIFVAFCRPALRPTLMS